MNTVIFWVGVVTVILLAIYVVLFLMHRILRIKDDPAIANDAMPALRPVPIPTKNQPSWLHKLAEFVYSVRRWELVENWHYTLPDGTKIVLHKGFRFDGASIPKIFWAALSPTGLLLIPGLLHDYGYRYDQLWTLDEQGCPVPWGKGEGKAFWDQLFLDVGNEVNGVALVNGIAWLAVNLGGSGSWERRRRQNAPIEEPVLEGCSRQP